MPHLPPAQYEANKRDSPNEPKIKEKQNENYHGFEFKPHQVNDSSQSNQVTDHLVSQDSYNNKREGRKWKNTAPPDQDSQGSKERKVPSLVMWYLPVIDLLKRMFSNAREAQLLLWHAQRKRDEKIRQPASVR
jgi:hypothetical protein